MRTLISFNGWWGFFFKKNIRMLAFTTILVAVSRQAISNVPVYRVIPILISQTPHN
jgi:hypothetical protein